MNMRIGIGYDIHRLVEGRALILGGVPIPCEKGLLGHSDADALIHAIMDAILGALALADIGTHFPDTDPVYKGMSSLLLLEKVREMMTAQGYRVGNLDAIIFAERPKMAPHRESMRRNLAQALQMDVSSVSIKAGTNEGCDAIGRGEAIACQAVILLEHQ